MKIVLGECKQSRVKRRLGLEGKSMVGLRGKVRDELRNKIRD